MLGLSIKIQHRLLLLVFLLCLGTTEANAGFLTPRIKREYALRMKVQKQREELYYTLEMASLRREYKRTPTKALATQIDSLRVKIEEAQKDIKRWEDVLLSYSAYEFNDTIINQQHFCLTDYVVTLKGGGRMAFGIIYKDKNTYPKLCIVFKGTDDDNVAMFVKEQISKGKGSTKEDDREKLDLTNQTIRLNSKHLYDTKAHVVFTEELANEITAELLYWSLLGIPVVPSNDDTYFIHIYSDFYDLKVKDKNFPDKDKFEDIKKILIGVGIYEIEIGEKIFEIPNYDRIFSTFEEMFKKFRESNL